MHGLLSAIQSQEEWNKNLYSKENQMFWQFEGTVNILILVISNYNYYQIWLIVSQLYYYDYYYLIVCLKFKLYTTFKIWLMLIYFSVNRYTKIYTIWIIYLLKSL